MAEPPPARGQALTASGPIPRTNLSRWGSPLIGRKKERLDVLRWLVAERARIVTVTGPRGVGKTHFAVSVSAEAADAFAAGARLVTLSALRDPDLVLPAIARELGLHGDAAESIGEHQLLLLLDGLDGLGEAGGLLAQLIVACPGLQLLVTTREPLPVPGEREYPLRPLPEAPAVELFRQRADAALPGVEVDYTLAAAICRRVGNLPLAIEAVAERITAFEPAAMLDRLERLLSAPAGESGGALAFDEAVRRALPAVDSL